MAQFQVTKLLDTATVQIRDVVCGGECRHRSPEECSSSTSLVFPYRGVYVRHVGKHDAVAEPNQVLMFNAGESYQVSHPVAGGDACLSLNIDEDLLRELVPCICAKARASPSAGSDCASISARRCSWRCCVTA
jgi:hypothetical protein